MFDHILIPFDGSDHVVWHVQEILTQCPAKKITLAHVVSSLPAEPAAVAQAERLLGLLDSGDPVCEKRTIEGEFGAVVSRLCEQLEPDLLALTTRENDVETVCGRVIDDLLGRVIAPILICCPKHCDGPRATKLRRLLAFLRYGAEAQEIMPFVEELAKLHDSELLLREPLGQARAESGIDLEIAEQQLTYSGLRAEAQAVMNPIAALPAVAASKDVDLIVMSRGAPNADPLFEGALLNSRRPVLSLRLSRVKFE